MPAGGIAAILIRDCRTGAVMHRDRLDYECFPFNNWLYINLSCHTLRCKKYCLFILPFPVLPEASALAHHLTVLFKAMFLLSIRIPCCIFLFVKNFTIILLCNHCTQDVISFSSLTFQGPLGSTNVIIVGNLLIIL